MHSDAEMEVVRRVYAKQVMARAMLDDSRLESAFAQIRREDFLGRGPWSLISPFGVYVRTPSSDPVYLYMDMVIGIIPERLLNNGQPSAHATWIASAAPNLGDHVVHVGAGTGYYSAIMAQLVGGKGKVTAVEFDAGLAAQARANLSSFSNAQVLDGDGTVMSFGKAEIIYVNAGATRPVEAWLDGLAEGGRLILPLTTDGYPNASRGAVFRFERRKDEFLAKWVSPVSIFPCEGARDPESEHALSGAFEKRGWDKVTKLYRSDDIPEDRCWLRGSGWCLAFS